MCYIIAHMKSSRVGRREKAVAPLEKILPSRALARILGYFATNPTSPVHFRKLQRITNLPHRSLQIELQRLQDLGVLNRATNGRLVEYHINETSSRWPPLRSLVREFAEPADLFRPALAQRAGITAAFIYGSFTQGDRVHAASDVDIFVVTESEPDRALRDLLAETALEIGGFIGREVNFTRFTRVAVAQLRDLGAGRHPGHGRSHFIRDVLSGPKLWLVGSEAELKRSLDKMPSR